MVYANAGCRTPPFDRCRDRGPRLNRDQVDRRSPARPIDRAGRVRARARPAAATGRTGKTGRRRRRDGKMTYPWETDSDAWKGRDAETESEAWRADEPWRVEPWKLEWWQLEAEGYGHSDAEGAGGDP
jgi:hypothetical protein